MHIVDTAEKGWQKRMESLMRNKEKFIIVTQDRKLAESLENNNYTVGILKTILFGSGSAVAGVSGLVKLAAGTSLMATADPEPITKSILVIVAAICFLVGSFFLYKIVKLLIDKKYKFKIRKTDFFGNQWEIEAEPG